MGGKSPGSGAVPLPGFGDAPEPDSSSGLPDLDPPVTPGAVALPGLEGGEASGRTAMDFRPPPRLSNPAPDGDAVPLQMRGQCREVEGADPYREVVEVSRLDRLRCGTGR